MKNRLGMMSCGKGKLRKRRRGAGGGGGGGDLLLHVDQFAADFNHAITILLICDRLVDVLGNCNEFVQGLREE